MDQVKRVNYFQGMMLVDEDFRDEQSYHRQTRHNHNLELHTWGVVRGLEVSLKAGALDVTEGLAIDANGKEMWWKGGAPKAAGNPDDGGYVVIEWNEELSDEYSQMAGKYLRLIDTCKFSFKSAAEANDVVLAKIGVRDSQIQEGPDNSGRRMAGSVRANGGDLEIRPVTSDGSLRLMTGAPLTARLTINAAGNVGIGSTKPGFALQVGDVDTVGSLRLCVAGRGSTGNYRQWTLRTGDGDNTADIHKLRIRDEQGAGDRLVIDQNGNVGIGTTTPGGKMDISVPYNATNVLKLNQSTPSWGSQELFNTFRYITTAFAGSEGDGPFRQFNVGGGGVSIGYPGVPTYGSSDALYVNGKVGIGTTTPAGRLNISEATGTPQSPNGGTLVIDHENNGGASSIVFRSKVNRGSDYGYIQYQDAATVSGGGESSLLIIGVENDADDHIILKPSGNVGLGTNTPGAKLTVQPGPTDTARVASGKALFVSCGMGEGKTRDGGIEFRHDNLSQGIGFGYNTIYATGANDSQELNLQSKGDASLNLNPAAGKVGIGTTNPEHRLQIGGNVDGIGFQPSDGSPNAGYIRFGDNTGWKLHFGRARSGASVLTGLDGVIMTLLDSGNVGIGTSDPKLRLDVQGAANIWSGTRYATANGFMAPGSLTIGNINANFGGGSGWNTNTAGLLLETMDNTEIVVHDANKRLASLMYYEGGDVNRITIGRSMDPSWGAISTVRVPTSITIGDWTLECRNDGAWGSPRSSLFIRYQSTDVARFGVVQDMLQIYPLDANLVRHGYFYWNKDGSHN
jgi:hypothetical protein